MMENFEEKFNFEIKVTRKHFIKDAHYTLLANDDRFIITQHKDSPPKYHFQLTITNQIYWEVNLHNRSLKQFGFKYKNEIRMFEASSEDLNKFRLYLACRVSFKDISDFYEPIRLLGRGGSSQVFLVQDKQNNDQYASKCIEKAYLQEEGGQVYQKIMKKALTIEIACTVVLDHPNIIRMREIYEGSKTFYIILENLDGGSLHSLISNQQKKGPFSYQNIQSILKGILKGLEHAHNTGIMHRDLKPDNIMFKKESDFSTVTIVDFGLATKTYVNPYFAKCGTPGYVAPEIANYKDGDPIYNELCDIFSLGVIFFKMITFKDLFPGNDYQETLRLNKKCIINLNILNMYKVPPLARDLLSNMLAINPQNRISATDALNHKFFSEDFSNYQPIEVNKAKLGFQTQKLVEQVKPLWKTEDFQVVTNNIPSNDDYEVPQTNDTHNFVIPVMNLKNSNIMGSFVLKESIRKKTIQPKQKGFKKFLTNDFSDFSAQPHVPSKFMPTIAKLQEKKENIDEQFYQGD